MEEKKKWHNIFKVSKEKNYNTEFYSETTNSLEMKVKYRYPQMKEK